LYHFEICIPNPDFCCSFFVSGAAGADTAKGAKGKKSAANKDGAKRGTAVSSTVDVEPVEVAEVTHPLLDPQSEQVDGKVYISGCMTLVNLNLSRKLNTIVESTF